MYIILKHGHSQVVPKTNKQKTDIFVLYFILSIVEENIDKLLTNIKTNAYLV